MVKVKLMSDWDSSKNVVNTCNKCTCPEQDYTWKNIEITSSDDADFFVIYNRPHKKLKEYYDPKRTIVFQFELAAIRKRWGEFYNPKDSDFYFVYDIPRYRPYAPDWMLNLTYNDYFDYGKFIPKSKTLSGVISDKNVYDGHKDRLKFLPFIDRNIPDYVQIGYGGKNLKSFSGTCRPGERYKYFNSFEYTFAAENSYEINYFTEKIISPILCECLPFYSGCPNIGDFIDPECYIPLNLKKPKESIEIIKKAIMDNEFNNRLRAIQNQKNKILTEEHPLEKIKNIIEGNVK